MTKNKIKIILLAGIGTIAVVFLLLSREREVPKGDFISEPPISLKEEDFSFDEVTNAYEKAKEHGQLPSDTESSVYSEEDDPKIKELQRQIELLEQQREQLRTQNNPQSAPVTATAAPVQTEMEQKMAYRRQLLKAREERLARSQDYSAPQEDPPSDRTKEREVLVFRAAVYKDQFILPGDRVNLILTQPLVYKGNLFEKNTFLYATANLQGSRILLHISNINQVPVNLIAKDLQDGEIGLYSKRAGELWREYTATAQSGAVREGGDELSKEFDIPLAGAAIRAFGTFFQKQKYRAQDKILLINDHELILVNTRP
ncbi:conjugative transposon protein TraM [Arenibacter sp. 6A1]|uniref:conjugative transposon protein TraM n=1 Tax=Arenibacter sp. 6A1 TaxID=2720391 RepID=UPI00144681F2|nr:conjugative transposon protein TraM [Arenibacter sp. 6A1]NKI28205.1 conjugative transposon protein TraM [Arenibacter sp. 6A1]